MDWLILFLARRTISMGTAYAVWPGIGTANAKLDGSRVLQSDFGKSVHKIVNECNFKHHVIKSFSLC